MTSFECVYDLNEGGRTQIQTVTVDESILFIAKEPIKHIFLTSSKHGGLKKNNYNFDTCY